MNIFTIQQGRVLEARWLPSPNYDERPDSQDISLLVIHNISLPAGQFGGDAISQLFTNTLDITADPSFAELEGLKVSSHLFIRRDGGVVQYVNLLQRAWHAGRSQFAGRDACNDFSIGIELEGTDTMPYADIQYEQLSSLSKAICQQFPLINRDRITGHSDIAPDRKTDPGPAFDWARYFDFLAKGG